MPSDLAERLRDLCRAGKTELLTLDFAEAQASGLLFDDILLLDADAEAVDAAAPHLAGGGVLAIARPDPMSRPIAMDLGRLHYDNIVYVGTTGSDLDAAYQNTPARAALQAGGLAWIAGAAAQWVGCTCNARWKAPILRASSSPPRSAPSGPMTCCAPSAGLAECRGATLAVIDPTGAPRDFATALSSSRGARRAKRRAGVSSRPEHGR